MDRDGAQPTPIPVDRGCNDLLERSELLSQGRLEVERVLDLRGNCSNHVFPVLSGSGEKKTPNLAHRKTTTQEARLRLVKSDDLDLCSSYNLMAGEPLGSPVLPCSMSLTAEGDNSIRSPISANVMPIRRRSEMKEAKGYEDIPPSLRGAVELSQRLPVTVFRNNNGMPRPPEMPKDLNTLGRRVRWWREHRKMSRATLAKRVGYKSVSGLSDLELDESHGSEKLHLIAAELKLNPHYLETGDGEPEAAFPQEAPPPPDEWPFPAISRSRLKRLNKIERGYLETELLKALSDIEAERRNRTG